MRNKRFRVLETIATTAALRDSAMTTGEYLKWAKSEENARNAAGVISDVEERWIASQAETRLAIYSAQTGTRR